MVNKYAISDIHGCLKTFKSLLKKISFSKSDELYILGDFIDRGHKAKASLITYGNFKSWVISCIV